MATAPIPPSFAEQGSQARVQISATDAVAATTVAAAATQAAEQRIADRTIRGLRANVDRLEASVASGQATIAELTAARETLIGELAARDHEYAQFVEGFRTSVGTIAATEEGRALLTRRRPGNLAQVRALLIDLADRREAAIQVRANVERAANRRAVAEIALDDMGRGEATADEVVTLYEAVTRLDPEAYSDWGTLSLLYVNVGRLPDARRAAQRALALAHNADEQAYALQAEGRVLVQEGNLNEALARFEDALSRVRAAVAASPTDPNLLRLLESQLAGLGYVRSLRGGELESALAAHAEALAIAQRLSDTYPENPILLRDLAYRLTSVGDVLTKQRNLREATTSLEMSSATWRELVAIDPQNQWDQEALAIALSRIGDVYALQDNFPSALAAFRESLQLVEAIVARDPNSQNRQLQAAALMKVAELQIALGELTEARRSIEQSLDTIRSLISQTPTSVTLRRDEAWSTFSLGEVERLSGNAEIAIAHFEMAATLFTSLLVASPRNADLQFAQLGAQFRLAQVRNNEGELRAAIDRFVALNGLQTQPYSERWVLDLRALAQTRGAR